MDRVGRYALVEPLGSGGMGQVFVAEDARPGGFRKRYACKLIDLSNPQYAERFLNEAVTGSRLHHDHIVQTHDFGETTDPQTGVRLGYIVTDLVDGLDLSAVAKGLRARGEPLPKAAALAVARSLSRALAYAWGEARDDAGRPLRVIHRDIKPTNVMISRSGVVKLLDFGLVRALTNPNPTYVQVPMGTVPYMAPELFAGGDIDCRVDVFSLGALLYSMLMGRRLYAERGAALHRVVAEGRVGPGLAALEARHPELVDLVAQAVAPAAADRYVDHRAFEAALQAAADREGSPPELGDLVRGLLPEEQPTEVTHRPGASTAILTPPSAISLTDALISETAAAPLPPTVVVQRPAPSEPQSAPAPLRRSWVVAGIVISAAALFFLWMVLGQR